MNNLGLTNIYTRIMGIAISHNNNSNSNNSNSNNSNNSNSLNSNNLNSTINNSNIKKINEKNKNTKQETPVMNFINDDDDDEISDDGKYSHNNMRGSQQDTLNNKIGFSSALFFSFILFFLT